MLILLLITAMGLLWCMPLFQYFMVAGVIMVADIAVIMEAMVIAGTVVATVVMVVDIEVTVAADTMVGIINRA